VTSPVQYGTFRPADVPLDYIAMAQIAEELRRQVMESRVNNMSTVHAILVTYPVDTFRGRASLAV
jgi:hypothetical protein